MTDLQDGLIDTFTKYIETTECCLFRLFVERITENEKGIYYHGEALLHNSFSYRFNDDSYISIPFDMLLTIYILKNEITKPVYEVHYCDSGVELYHCTGINAVWFDIYDWTFIKYAICSILIDSSPDTFKKVLVLCDSLDDITDDEIEITLRRLNKLNRPDITSTFMKYIHDNTNKIDIKL